MPRWLLGLHLGCVGFMTGTEDHGAVQIKKIGPFKYSNRIALSCHMNLSGNDWRAQDLAVCVMTLPHQHFTYVPTRKLDRGGRLYMPLHRLESVVSPLTFKVKCEI